VSSVFSSTNIQLYVVALLGAATYIEGALCKIHDSFSVLESLTLWPNRGLYQEMIGLLCRAECCRNSCAVKWRMYYWRGWRWRHDRARRAGVGLVFRRRRWNKHVCVAFETCIRMVSSVPRCTPRSRTVVSDCMTSVSLFIVTRLWQAVSVLSFGSLEPHRRRRQWIVEAVGQFDMRIFQILMRWCHTLYTYSQDRYM